MKNHIRSIELLEARIAPATFTVTSNANGGAGSLGQALFDASMSMGVDTIAFNLPMGQLIMVHPGFTIDHPVIFDGRSQPGYVDAPLVVLQGEQFAQKGFRFQMGSEGSQVLGMKITAFSDAGIEINTSNITVAGCDIVANANGIYVAGADAVIGTSGESGKNVISGNSIYGITGGFYVSGLTVQNSHIGVDRAGTTAMGNAGGGIYFESATEITIGGVGRNVISANGPSGGISLLNCFGNYRIQSSTIGLSATGQMENSFSNNRFGVVLEGAGTYLIGSDGFAGSSANIIANNIGTELAVNTSDLSLTGLTGSASITGNYIGTKFSGMSAVPATAATIGIRAQGPNIVIGSNTIFSQGDGIVAEPGVRILGNEFFQVGGLVIDVDPDGSTPNDAGDLDAVQNKPELNGVAVVSVGNQYVVAGTFDAKPYRDYLLNLYGYDGQRYTNLSTIGISAGSSGHVDINVTGISFAGFTQVAATVTDEGTGNTSEMSALANVAPGIAFVGNTSISQIEGNSAFQILTFNVLATAPLTGAVTVELSPAASNTATLGVDYSFSPTSLSFGPAVTSQLVSVIIPGDTSVEPDEIAKLVLGNLTGNAVLVVPAVNITIGNDDTSLKITPDSKTATWIDADGDLITLKTTKPVLNPGMFSMTATGSFGGELVQDIDFGFATGDPKGTNLAVTAKFEKTRNRGDAAINIGTIFANGTDLGIVTIPGDLGGIQVGDANVADGALKSLTVGSAGVLGTAQNYNYIFRGKVGTVTVRGDVVNTTFINDTTMEANPAAGSFGSITIGGNFEASQTFASRIFTSGDIGSVKLTGSLIVTSPADSGISAGGKIGLITIGGSVTGTDGRATIFANTTLGKTTIGGSLDNAYLAAGGKAVPLNAAAAIAIAGVTVKGRVQDSLIESGIDLLGKFNPDTQIGAISVGGDWIRSSVAASVSAGADGKYGTDDDALLTANTPFTNNAAIVSKIAAVFIKGQIHGTYSGTDNYGFVAQTIGKFGRGAAAYTLKTNPIPNSAPLDVFALGITGDVFLREVI